MKDLFALDKKMIKHIQKNMFYHKKPIDEYVWEGYIKTSKRCNTKRKRVDRRNKNSWQYEGN